LTGDPAHGNQVVQVNGQGQVVYNDKLYQICEFLKPDSNEKVIMVYKIISFKNKTNTFQSWYIIFIMLFIIDG
jgi:hypothetical protein